MEHAKSLFSMNGTFCCISLDREELYEIISDFWMIFNDEEFHDIFAVILYRVYPIAIDNTYQL